MSEGARIIWVLFGEMTDFESDVDKLKDAYRRHSRVAAERGYTLGLPKYFQTKRTLLALLGDRATRALIWHSHGAYTGWGPKGNIVDREKVEISPADLESLGLQLDFAAVFGCAIAKDAERYKAWKRALGLARHPGGYGTFASRMIADTEKTWFWGRRYGRLEPAAQKFAEYQFPRWVADL